MKNPKITSKNTETAFELLGDRVESHVGFFKTNRNCMQVTFCGVRETQSTTANQHTTTNI